MALTEANDSLKRSCGNSMNYAASNTPQAHDGLFDAFIQKLHFKAANKKARYQLSSRLSSIHAGCRWLLDLGSNQGPTD
jgi:hypothetical protein